MAIPSQDFQIRKGYFHSVSRVPMRNDQNTFESTIKSRHTNFAKDILIDNIPYLSNVTERDNFILANPNIIKYYDKYSLTPVAGTNNQLYRAVDINNNIITNWLAPVDVVNNQGLTSQGLAATLFNNNTPIPLSSGVYIIDYASSLVLFQIGYTPVDLGYTDLKLSFCQYIGKTLAESQISLEPLLGVYNINNTQYIMPMYDIYGNEMF